MPVETMSRMTMWHPHPGQWPLQGPARPRRAVAVARLLLAGLLVVLAHPAFGLDPQVGCRPVLTRDPPPLNACQDARRVRLAIVGDVLLHAPVQRRGYAEGFKAVWGAALPWFAKADLVTANLEGPTAPGLVAGGRQVGDPGPVFDNRVHTGYPLFNYHPVVIDDLRASGVSLVTTANNHALDRGPAGASATLQELARRGMPQTGLIEPGAARDFLTVLDSPLGPIGFIACTYSTNGIPAPHRQVLMCFEDRAEVLAAVRRAARDPALAAVVVLPHWGTEYSHRPEARQQALARDLALAGAAVIVGTHPHVVQPWEVVEGPVGRAVLVAHSTGNFVSNQVGLARQAGIIAWVELCRAALPEAVRQGDIAAGLRAAPLAVAETGWIPLRMIRPPAGGPALSVPEPGARGEGGAVRGLIAQHIPDHDLSARMDCRPDLLPEMRLQ